MKVLNLSLDKTILDINSRTAKRMIDIGDVADKYVIIAPAEHSEKIKLSEKVFAYGSGGGNKISRLLNVYKTAKGLLRQEGFDIVTVQDQYYLALVGLFLARKFKAGLELQIHGFEKYSGLRKVIAKFAISRADAIRCVSNRLKRKLIQEFGVEEDIITVVPVFVESGKWKSKDKEFDRAKSDKFVFITVGRLVPVKNIGLQIKAIREVIKRYPNIELWIIGNGPEKINLIEQSSRLGLESKIRFLGWQDNPSVFYKQADAFLFTSDAEGWGMVAIEAASYGLPIIMTDVGLAGEVIKNEESGLVIPTNNQARLEEAMIKIINDDSLRQKLTENATKAIKNLSNKEETMTLYKKSWSKATKNN